MKPSIIEVIYSYTYPPSITIRKETNETECYLWANYPYAQNLNTFGPLADPLIYSSISFINNTSLKISQTVYQPGSNQSAYLMNKWIEQVSNIIIAIRYRGTTYFQPWTVSLYQRDLGNFKPWFPVTSFFAESAVEIQRAEITNIEKSPFLSSCSFFSTSPQKTAPLFVPKLVVPQPMHASSQAISDEEFQIIYEKLKLPDPTDNVSEASNGIENRLCWNTKNYRENPNIIPYLSTAQKLEIAAKKVISYTNAGLTYPDIAAEQDKSDNSESRCTL